MNALEKENLVLELRNVSKSFPGVQALSDVSLEIRPGEVHALVGENGAGKSTLIKVITGFHAMDSGVMLVDGREVSYKSPHESIENGISCIYQELSIVPLIDVAKNLYLGNWPKKSNGIVDKKAMYEGARKVLEHIHLDVEPDTLAGDLPIAQQQMVEIGRALTRNARVIIMDEPTSSLTDKETEVLFQLIRELKQNGVSIIYISHKLDEVLEISDRITVLCDGRNVTMVNAAETDRKHLIEYMLGRTLEDLFNKVPAKQGDPVLEVRGLTRKGVFEDISFQVHSGEVLGFFGLVGAGRSEIMRAIFGIDKLDAGEILVEGKPVRIHNSKDAIRCGLALVTEDRKRSGLALEQTVMENITLPQLPRLKKGLFINAGERQRMTDKYIEELRVKTPSSAQIVGNLSGGNQQKVVVAKWLMGNPKILILDEPTRGIDVGSKAEIYGLISDLASQGVGVILVSSELSEVVGVSDRIITIHEGHISAEFITKESTDRQILAAAFGGEIDDKE